MPLGPHCHLGQVLQEIRQTEEKVFFRPLRLIAAEVKEMIGDA